MPGGKIDMGEAAEKALVREIKEETALGIYNVKFLTYFDSVFEEEFYKRCHMLLLNYTCRTHASTVVLNEEAQGFCWAKPKAALGMDINRPTKALIEFILKNA